MFLTPRQPACNARCCLILRPSCCLADPQPRCADGFTFGGDCTTPQGSGICDDSGICHVGAIWEDIVDIPDAEVAQVMNWIKAQVTVVKNPFCWKDSYGRGVGTIPGRVADCPPGMLKSYP